MKLCSTLVLIVVAAATIGCGSSSPDGRSHARAGDRASRGEANPPAVYNTVRDARVLLYQPKTKTTLIIVNNHNSKRRTRAGRMELANQQAAVGYKTLTDRQVDALLESFENRDAGVLRERWTAEHDRYLTASDGQYDRLRGIIMVENDGRRWAYVGKRPQGRADALGQQRYKVFADMKFLMVSWYNTDGSIERPDAVNAGLTPIDADSVLETR